MRPYRSAIAFVALSAGVVHAAPAPGFPCELKNLPFRPALVFLGEEHDDVRSQEVKTLAIGGGERGDYYVALEALHSGPADEIAAGHGLPRERSRLFGLEGSPATSFAAFWALTSRYSPRAQFVPPVQWLDLLKRQPHAREAFRAAVRNGRITEPRSVEFALAAADAPDDPRTRDLFLFIAPEDRPLWTKALVQARIEAAEIMRREYDEDWVNGIAQGLSSEADTPDMDLGAMMAIRDRDFAITAASLYCQAAREKRNLVIGVGSDHVPGVRRLLYSWADAADADIDFWSFYTKDAKNAANAAAKLRAWSGSPAAPVPDNKPAPVVTLRPPDFH